MHVPDILGYPLEEALGLLEETKIKVSIDYTFPPRAGQPSGEKRVIRVTKNCANEVQFVVAYKDCPKGGV